MTNQELLIKYDEIGFRILQVEDSPRLHALENEFEDLRGEILSRMVEKKKYDMFTQYECSDMPR